MLSLPPSSNNSLKTEGEACKRGEEGVGAGGLRREGVKEEEEYRTVVLKPLLYIVQGISG